MRRIGRWLFGFLFLPTLAWAWPATGYWNFHPGAVTQLTCADWTYGTGEWTAHIYSDPAKDADCPWWSTDWPCTLNDYPPPSDQCATTLTSTSTYINCVLDSQWDTTFYESQLAKDIYGKPRGAQNWVRVTRYFKSGPKTGTACQETWGGAQSYWQQP